MAEEVNINEAIAALTIASLRTQVALDELLVRSPRPGPGAGPAGVTALQIVRKSPETTVQLSLSDTQYTVLETSGPTGLTVIDALPETTQVQMVNKSDILLDFHRNRGFKVRDAQRTLPDGAWVNDTPDDVDRYRLPSPPLRSLTHSELNRREQSAVTALARR